MNERTVREGGNGATAGRTVRDDSSVGGTVREGAGDGTLREDGGSPKWEGNSGRAWLPAALANRFEVVEELPTRGMEADLLVVAGEDGSRFVAKIYRRGIKPNEEILRILKEARFEHVVRLEEFGEENGNYWELIEYIEHSSLRALIDHEGPKLPEATVRQILRELNDALTHLHGLPIEHRDLKPDNVLVRTRDPIDLVLADFGIASLMDASVRETSAHRTISYAPPEAIGVFTDEDDRSRRNVAVVRTRWDYWSLGMILVEMLAGEHPFKGRSEAVIAHRLATQNVDDLIEGVEPVGWRKLCRGLLRRDPRKRWGSEQVSLWLANQRDYRLTVEDEVEPNRFQAPPLIYCAKPCHDLKDLLQPLRQDWETAKEYFATGTNLKELTNWLRFKLGMGDLADAINGTDTDTTLKTIEGRTFSFIQTIAKFSGDDQVEYKGRELAPETIKKIAETAAKGDRKARARLLDLYENGIVIIAGKFEQDSSFSKIASNWRDAVNDYRTKIQDVERNGARGPALEGDTLVKLLAASLPVSSVVSELRSAAQRAITSDARECSWFRNLGDPDKATIAAIMIMPHVIREAEAGAKQRKEQRNKKLGIIAAGTVAVAVFVFVVSNNISSRRALAAAAADIEGIIPVGEPGGTIFFPFIDRSASTFLIRRQDAGVHLEIQGNSGCSWTLSPISFEASVSVKYAADINRNAIGRFFMGNCGGPYQVQLSRQSDTLLEMQIFKNGESIGRGTFNRVGYDSAESRRVSSLSASVWATAGNSSQALERFTRWGTNIVMRASADGDFQTRDSWEFRVEYPSGGWGTCPQMSCTIRRNEDGSYTPGTYTLKALTSHRTLATASFSVN